MGSRIKGTLAVGLIAAGLVLAFSWAGGRKQITAGTISITRAEDQSTGNCNAINFDPLVLPRGIAPSGDPILRARSAAYAESYRRRARETLLESN